LSVFECSMADAVQSRMELSRGECEADYRHAVICIPTPPSALFDGKDLAIELDKRACRG
jgi:hypothetical protein